MRDGWERNLFVSKLSPRNCVPFVHLHSSIYGLRLTLYYFCRLVCIEDRFTKSRCRIIFVSVGGHEQLQLML